MNEEEIELCKGCNTMKRCESSECRGCREEHAEVFPVSDGDTKCSLCGYHYKTVMGHSCTGVDIEEPIEEHVFFDSLLIPAVVVYGTIIISIAIIIWKLAT